MRGPFWSSVTGIPRRVKPCTISTAIGPPPMFTKLAGTSSSSNRLSLVTKPASCSPSIGGTAGRLPVHNST
jgi:hypothetical protein